MSAASKIDAAHFGIVRQVAFDSNGEQILSLGEDDGRIFLWNAEDMSRGTGNNIETDSGNDVVRTILFSNDKQHFLYAGENGKVMQSVWPECASYQEVLTKDGIIEIIAQNSKTLNFIIASGNICTVLDASFNVVTEIPCADKITWMGFSQCGAYFACMDSAANLRVFDAGSFGVVFEQTYQIGIINPVWGPNSQLVIDTGKEAGVCTVIDFAAGQRKQDIKINCQSRICQLAYASTCLAVADESQNIVVVKIAPDLTVKQIFNDNYDGSKMTAMCWCKGSLAGGDEDGNVFKWQSIADTEGEVEEDDTVVVPVQPKEKPKTVNSFLQAVSDKTAYQKPKSTVSTKKSKSKGKQQTLNVQTEARPKPTKIQKKIEIESDSDSEEEDIPQNDLDDEAEGGGLIVGAPEFIVDDDDDDVEMDVPVAAKQEVEMSDDDIDIDVAPQKVSADFLGDEVEDDEVGDANPAPDYEDLVLPGDSDMESDVPVDDELGDEAPKKRNPSPYDSVDYGASTTFMPGSSTEFVNNTKIMCWNGDGSMCIQMDSMGRQKLQMLPSETSDFYAKVISDDVFSLVAATVDEHGYAYATRSSVTYHKHGVYGPEAEITKDFSLVESVELIAIGLGWFAVATSLNRLHIFTGTGLPLAVMALDGRIITIVGANQYLFVVYGGNHRFELYDVTAESSLASGFVPIRSPLRWAGFDLETFDVVVEGGDYVFEKLSRAFGTRWTPVLDMKQHFDGKNTGFYPISIENDSLFGLFLTGDAKGPSEKPSDDPTLEEISFAALSVDAEHGKCVNALMHFVNSRNTEKRDAAARALDKQLFIQFSEALGQNKHLLAVQIASRMKTEQGRSLTIRRADQTGQKQVAERLIAMFAELESSDSDDETESDSLPPFVRTQQPEEEEEVPEPEPEPEPEVLEPQDAAEEEEIEEEPEQEAETEKKTKKSRKRKTDDKEPKKRKTKPKKKLVPASQMASLGAFGFT